MKIIERSIQQPITVAVGVILSALAGLIALDRVPVQMTPEIEDAVIAVTTTWENATPQEVETEVVDVQEERLQGVTNLRSITSMSQRGRSEIRLEFLTGTNMESALREVSDKLREVPSYPENVDEPVVKNSDPDSRDFIAWVVLASTDPTFDISTLFDFVDKRIKPQFERIPGLSEVGIIGGREQEVQIRVDPTLLAQRGITMATFVNVIRTTNRNYSAGALSEGKFDIRIRALGRFHSPEQVLDTVIRQDPVGGPVYVRDVATVVETYKEADSFVSARGVPVIALNFRRELGSNVLVVMKALKAELARLNKPGSLLDFKAKELGINGTFEMVQPYDQTTYIDDALDLVRSNLYLGGSIAIIMLFLFLRSFRSVAIIAFAIPISIVGSFAVLVALGRSVNVISLAGMAFAVGMVVDNAIVVLENIYRHREMDKSIRQAVFDGTAEVARAVLASTLTTIIVFIPILLVQASVGQLFRDIALAVCAAVGLSYIVSITVIPSLGAFLLSKSFRRKISTDKTSAITKRPRPKVPRAVAAVVDWMIGRTVLKVGTVALFILVSVGGTIILMPPIDYLPSGNRNIVFGALIPPPGMNMGTLLELKERLERNFQPAWQATPRAFSSEVQAPPPSEAEAAGTPAPPPIRDYFAVVSQGQMFHGAISDDPKRVVDLIPFFEKATDSSQMPGVIAFARQPPLFSTGGASGAAVKIDLVGPNLENVSDSATALFMALFREYGPYAVQPKPTNFNLPSLETQTIPDMKALAQNGLTVQDLGLAVQASGDGVFAGDYARNGDLIDLKIIATDALGQAAHAGLRDVMIATATGKIVALGDVARVVTTTQQDQIQRVGRQRAVTLQFTAPKGMPLQEAIEQIETRIASMQKSGAIMPDVDVQFAGSASKLQEAQEALMGDGTAAGILASSLFLALAVVYLLMCVLFQSWTYPLVILISVPLATFGGFLALAGVHAWSVSDRYMPVQNLDMLTMLGFVILAGVVVNNAILIVHQTLNLLSAGSDGSLTPREAIVRAVESRVRPILMSTLTSVGGMLPLVLMPGSGSELYRGLGSVVVGGLLVSTLFTLLLVPILLSILFDLRALFKQRKVTV